MIRLCIYLYIIIINMVIITVICRRLSETCKVAISEGCFNCNSDITRDTICSLDAIVESSETLMMNSTTRSYFFSWYFNGDIITPANSLFSFFTAEKPTQTCISSSHCTVNTNLRLPKGFSSRYHGTYTQTLTTSKEKGEEIVTCSVNVCSKNIIEIPNGNEKDNTDTEDGILIQYFYVYIIAGLAGFFLLMFLILTITVIRLKIQVKVKPRPQLRRDDDDDNISVDEPSVAVSNHTYASVQLSIPGRYNTLGIRSPSSRHRYDEPTLDRNDEGQYLEMNARGTSPQRALPHYNENGRQKIIGPGLPERQKRDPNSSNAAGNSSASTVDLIHTRQQKSNVPDIIVHDYQNIRRTRRLT